MLCTPNIDNIILMSQEKLTLIRSGNIFIIFWCLTLMSPHKPSVLHSDTSNIKGDAPLQDFGCNKLIFKFLLAFYQLKAL